MNTVSREIDLKGWKRIITILRDEGVLFLTLTGGEPLIRDDFMKIAEFASRKGMALRIFTNGTLLDGEAVKRLKDLNLVEVEISLHGSEEVHDFITGEKGAFRKVIRSIDFLREEEIKVNLKMCVMKPNFQEIGKVYEMGRERGAQAFFDFFITPRDNGDRTPLSLRLDEKEIISSLNELKGLFSECGEGKGVERRRYLCGAGVNFFNISPSGDVFPCIQLRIPCGNILEHPFKKIWYGKNMRNVRKLLMEFSSKCRGCSYADFCHFCIGINMLENGSFSSPSKYSCLLAKVRKDIYNKKNLEEKDDCGVEARSN